MLSAAEFKNAGIEPSQSSSGKRASTSKNTHAKGFPDERSRICTSTELSTKRMMQLLLDRLSHDPPHPRTKFPVKFGGS